MTKQSKILVIKLGALGDFFQALGPMAAIRRHHKDSHITLLTTKPFENFARQSGYFDSILIDSRPRWNNLSGWLSLRKNLNAENFIRIYDLQNNDRSSLYFRLFKNPKPEWSGVAKGASHRNTNPTRTAGHAYDGHVQTLALAGITNIKPDTLDWMITDIAQFPLQTPYVLLVPGCAPEHPQKRWPAKYYAELAAHLTNENIQPVIIGGPAEKEIATTIKNAVPTALDLTSQTSLHQIATLAKSAKSAIGNDTGPMHIIGQTGCPSLVLFSGYSNPIRHAPKGTHVSTLQKDDLKDLTVNEVIKAVTKIFNEEKCDENRAVREPEA